MERILLVIIAMLFFGCRNSNMPVDPKGKPLVKSVVMITLGDTFIEYYVVSDLHWLNANCVKFDQYNETNGQTSERIVCGSFIIKPYKQ